MNLARTAHHTPLPAFVTSRNAAAGSLRQVRYDPSDLGLAADARKLHFFAYHIFTTTTTTSSSSNPISTISSSGPDNNSNSDIDDSTSNIIQQRQQPASMQMPATQGQTLSVLRELGFAVADPLFTCSACFDMSAPLTRTPSSSSGSNGVNNHNGKEAPTSTAGDKYYNNDSSNGNQNDLGSSRENPTEVQQQQQQLSVLQRSVYQKCQEMSLIRSSLNYDIDGAVIKVCVTH
jgi:NAD-dependent DNA ligase